MFKRLYAIGAHEDLFPPMRRTRFSPRFGTASTKAWYRQYHTVVQRVPHRGIESTTPWYREYHAVVFQPIAYCPLENLLAKYCSYIETK